MYQRTARKAAPNSNLALGVLDIGMVVWLGKKSFVESHVFISRRYFQEKDSDL